MTDIHIFSLISAAGIEYANHESDLYIPVNENTRNIVNAYKFRASVTTFQNNIDGKIWFDIPFAYLPYWEAKQKQTEVKP